MWKSLTLKQGIASFLIAIAGFALTEPGRAETKTASITLPSPSWNSVPSHLDAHTRVCPDPITAAAHGSQRANAPLPPAENPFDGSRAADVTLAAVGDVLLHSQLQRQGFADYAGFRSLWRKMEPFLSAADIAIANLEGPVAEDIQPSRQKTEHPVTHYDNHVYTGYPLFNYPPAALHALTAAGIDLVSIANNHSYDRGQVGFEATIDALQRNGLAFAGGRSVSAPAGTPHWGAATAREGDKIAFVACSYGFNVRAPDGRQAPLCFDDRAALLQIVANLSCRRDIAGVVFLPHWGQEYVAKPTKKQRELAYQALEAGAMAVIGAHPHVVQPVEPYRTADGRDGVIAFSLGNFASAQVEEPRRTAIVLYLGLNRQENGKLAVGSIRYLPIETEHQTTPDGKRFTVKPIADPEAAAVRYQDLVAQGRLLTTLNPTSNGGTSLGLRPNLPHSQNGQTLDRLARGLALDVQKADTLTTALTQASAAALALQDQRQTALLQQAAIQARVESLQVEQDHTDHLIAGIRTSLGKVTAPSETTKATAETATIPSRHGATHRLVVNADTLFAPNSALIRTDANSVLKTIADTVKSWSVGSEIGNDSWRIEVQGHADERPVKSRAYRSNRHLSTERALAVVEALIAAGVDDKRLYASGLGASDPIAPEDTAEAHAQNRRVELILHHR
jgi:flagellar motor protein MotB